MTLVLNDRTKADIGTIDQVTQADDVLATI
jgi:hypothetical protein